MSKIELAALQLMRERDGLRETVEAQRTLLDKQKERIRLLEADRERMLKEMTELVEEGERP
jgi:hypothetical protein